ncbi:arsenate reductase (glutaredoxin) [Gallibacterium melopsittaci]|uniref:Arsenate reductase n=1 Tax=Gallibacterium melopsittaci TaxID=516063 RepID=A0ABV6HY37_9PAST
METITIYHNPNCGTSRNVLALIQHLGFPVKVIYYLDTPPSVEELRYLLQRMHISARQLLRKNVTPYVELDLDNLDLTEDFLIQKMIEFPILINRPIVISSMGVKLCRPSEEVLTILPKKLTEDFIKEDGEVIRANSV